MLQLGLPDWAGNMAQSDIAYIRRPESCATCGEHTAAEHLTEVDKKIRESQPELLKAGKSSSKT